jgi:hypothetical protein
MGVREINLGHDVKGRHHGKGGAGFIGTQSQVAAGSRSVQQTQEGDARSEAPVRALLLSKRRTGAACRRIATEKEGQGEYVEHVRS